MIKEGTKFIIEIGEVFKGAESGKTRYRIKGFDSLVFDDNGLKRLTKAKDNSMYCTGFSEGKDAGYHEGYSEGASDMFENLKEFLFMSERDKEIFFGTSDTDKLRKLSAAEFAHTIKNFAEYRCRDEIKVGDEVLSSDADENIKGIVLAVNPYPGRELTVLHYSGELCSDQNKAFWRKTGKHFDILKKVLNAVKGNVIL